MKAHTTLTIHPDLLERAKKEGIILSDLLEQSLQIALRKNPSIQIKLNELKCSWCNQFIVIENDDDTIYYECIFHGNIFCNDCAHNNYTPAWHATELGEAPHCRNNLMRQDCIYAKKIIKKLEEEE